MNSQEILKSTTSRCPECLQPCPAQVIKQGSGNGQIFLSRTCPTHGTISHCISSDARFYWLSKGSGDACCGGVACSASNQEVKGALGKNAESSHISNFERLSTCVALIEIVNSCNLSCPTCYANSPLGVGDKVDAVPLDDLKNRIDAVAERKGNIEILQLSGGEPTIHPQFFELLDWIAEHPKVDYVLINTNGVRLAKDAEFLEGLNSRVRRGHMQVYLQFDGTHESGQKALRGADLRTLKAEAIANCEKIGLPITLAMTVTSDNVSTLWEAAQYGLTFSHVRGITYQPFFGSGRSPNQSNSSDIFRLNPADVIIGLVEQSKGVLKYDDFTPLPCGDPNCATIGYLLKIAGQVRSISDFIDFAKVQGFLQDRMRYSIEDLARCGCEAEPLGEILKQLELDASHTFRIFIKPFMDAYNWDEDRIDRCCTHVITPEGKLDSFCRYYSGFPKTKSSLNVLRS